MYIDLHCHAKLLKLTAARVVKKMLKKIKNV